MVLILIVDFWDIHSVCSHWRDSLEWSFVKLKVSKKTLAQGGERRVWNRKRRKKSGSTWRHLGNSSPITA